MVLLASVLAAIAGVDADMTMTAKMISTSTTTILTTTFWAYLAVIITSHIPRTKPQI